MCSSRSAVLSGGEKTRLALVKLLLDPPNLLLMDEPTTHLDVGSIDALIGALRAIRGNADFHQPRRAFHPVDREDRAAHQRGEADLYAGDYQYYLDKSRAGSERAALMAGEKLQNCAAVRAGAEARNGGPGMKEMREQRRVEAEKRKAEAKVKREKQKAAEALEMRILRSKGGRRRSRRNWRSRRLTRREARQLI